MTTHFAETISIYSATDVDGIIDGVPFEVLFKYAVVMDDSGSWILTTEESASALAVYKLPYADQVNSRNGEYSDFWEFIAKSIEVIGDSSNPIGAARAICAREGVEMLGD